MLRIGLTGGIGSGKTTVAQIFEVLGVPVYYADDAARRLMNENKLLRKQLTQNFGEEIFEGNILNRSRLASLVFDDPAKTNLLNSLVHPVTIADADDWLQKRSKDKIPYAVKEAALIFESNAQLQLDYVIGVSAPYHLRLARAMKRANLSQQEVELRMQRQMNEEKKMSLCDFVIVNDEAELLIPQVVELDKKLRGMELEQV